MFISKSDLKVWKITLALGLPIIIQELINSAINLADSVMVGKLGDQAINAVGFGNEINFVFIIIVFGIVSGSAIFMGQFWGKKDLPNLHKTIGFCGMLAMCVAIIFVLLCQTIPHVLVGFYIKDDSVIALGVQYLRIVSLSYFLVALTVTFNAALKSTGNTFLPMLTSIGTLCINVVLNYLFIFVFKKGVVGAATATLIARSMEFLILLTLVRTLKVPVLAPLRNYFRWHMSFAKEFLHIVWPVFVNELTWVLGVTLYKKAYGNLGTTASTAIQIVLPIQQSFLVVGLGIGSATGILIANTLGAGERDRAIEYSRKSARLAVILSLVMSLLLLVFSAPMIQFYDASDLSKAYAQKVIFVIAVGMIIKTYNFTAIVGILRNGGDTLFCLIIDLVSVWFVGVPLAFMGSYLLGWPVYLVFLLAYGEEVFKLIFCIIRVRSNKWATSLVQKME